AKVEELIKTGKIKIYPPERKAETLGFFKQGLEDFSISREKVTWGIPLPFDPKQIAYVWVDALPNYISAIGYGDNPDQFKKWWTEAEVIHLMAKEIIKFHNIWWPAMLLSVGLKPPDVILNHGFFTVKGQKMSKSLGNVIDPNYLVSQFGSDATRYLLLTQFPLGVDGDIQADRFIEKFNSELANDLGNLISRIAKMIADYCSGAIPEPKNYDASDNEIMNSATRTPDRVMDLIYELKVTTAIEEVFKLVKKTNQYVEASAPWNLAKNRDFDKLNTKLYVSAEVLRIISALIYPVVPNKAAQIRKVLGFSGNSLVPSLQKARKWGVLPKGQNLGKIEALFPRMETKKVEVKPVEDNLIGIEDFGKVQLRVAEVRQAEKVAGADKLLKLQVMVGDKEKQIVAGIAQHYQPEELIGRKIIVVDNLKPATLRGIISEGMLLAAQDGKSLVLLTVDKDIGSGAKIS
ncbi:MAG: methionine--tRNA ligase subunit beta, partial [candidate division Zixibacteria bacterium RBG_16_50_21]